VSKLNLAALDISALEPQAKPYLIYDAKQPGLYLQVSPGGTASFYVGCRRTGGGPVKMKLGKADRMNVTTARIHAKEWLPKLAAGEPTPAQQRKRERITGEALATVGEALETYIKVVSSPGYRNKPLRASSATGYRYCIKPISDWRLAKITRAKVQDFWIDSDQPYNSKLNTMRVLRTVINFIIERNADDPEFPLQKNPVDVVRRQLSNTPAPTNRKMISAEFLPTWFKATSERGTLVADAMLVMLYTGARRNEILSLRWEEVDWAEKTLRLVDTKNHKSPLMPLPQEVADLIEPRRAETGWVFPGEGDKPKIGVQTDRRAIVEASAVDFSCHSLRRFYARCAEELGVNYLTTARLLNHAVTGLTGHYSDTGEVSEDMRRASALICGRIGSLTCPEHNVIKVAFGHK